jgi:hypothetical protein
MNNRPSWAGHATRFSDRSAKPFGKALQPNVDADVRREIRLAGAERASDRLASRWVKTKPDFLIRA